MSRFAWAALASSFALNSAAFADRHPYRFTDAIGLGITQVGVAYCIWRYQTHGRN